MKSGFVSIIGRPNVGKSTLINAILDTKLSIVTSKSQTTRDLIKGIYNDNDSQIVFIDTPGIHKPIKELGKLMNKKAFDSLKDIDAAIIVIDASKYIGNGDKYISENIKVKVPTFIILNKIDLVNINDVIKAKEEIAKLYPSTKVIEMSAIKGFNIDTLIKELKEVLVEGPQYYPLDMISDVDHIFKLKEIIREKVLLCLNEEVPHNIAIRLDDIKTQTTRALIHASIVVSKDSQKGIVIGKGGKMLKKIGTLARKDMEDLLKKSIRLEILVKVDEGWIDNSSALKKYGY